MADRSTRGTRSTRALLTLETCDDWLGFLDDKARRTARRFEVLLALVRRRGQLIPKEELLQLVWGDVAVTDANLTPQIFTLRRLFGEEAHCIITVSRRGYRFTASRHLRTS